MKFIISENQSEEISNLIQEYLNNNLETYYGIKKFVVKYSDKLNYYKIIVFFDKQTAIEMGLGVNMLTRRALAAINQELSGFFSGIDFNFDVHFD